MIYFKVIQYFIVILSVQILSIFEMSVSGSDIVSLYTSIGQFCRLSNECQMHSYCYKKNESLNHGTCQCLPRYVLIYVSTTYSFQQCIESRHYYQPCEYSEQCKHLDNNSICDTEIGLHTLRCLCSDYHRFDHYMLRCQWCNDHDCRRHPEKYSYSSDKWYIYDKWYINVDKRLVVVVCASLLIMAIPISIFVFMFGLRYTRKIIGSRSSINPNYSSRLIVDFGNELEMRVSIPPEVVRVELPPSYEECIKPDRLPSYEEAVLINNS